MGILVYFSNYLILRIFIISFGIFILNYYGIWGDNSFVNFNLLESYECGFDTFHNKLITYNLQFFNIGVSYIIFDLEIAIIFVILILIFTYFNFMLRFRFLRFLIILLKVYMEEVFSL